MHVLSPAGKTVAPITKIKWSRAEILQIVVGSEAADGTRTSILNREMV